MDLLKPSSGQKTMKNKEKGVLVNPFSLFSKTTDFCAKVLGLNGEGFLNDFQLGKSDSLPASHQNRLTNSWRCEELIDIATAATGRMNITNHPILAEDSFLAKKGAHLIPPPCIPWGPKLLHYITLYFNKLTLQNCLRVIFPIM